ncbi:MULTISPECIES: hypothetical protein [unclassified Leifsonia]|uniref:hypothetical protein n=1 Tax=unclassified Leifsonia TaxID=2663824 RepID=UPI0006F5C22D|nr:MULTISPECIES: hypothetical protein [unclassified Leifsonia]KQX06923.1 hypothetical protein ASC59_03645 [Leifsonia sp. Root1293]KRA11207.1 hypothetical protein ASD61_03645 [Leifsonia sp. Root60]
MTDSTTTDGAQPDTGAHSEQPLLAGHEPEEALALGRRMAEPAADDATAPGTVDAGPGGSGADPGGVETQMITDDQPHVTNDVAGDSLADRNGED